MRPLSDVNTFEDVAFWATQKEAWLKRFLTLANGIPSHDTFNRVFRILDPKTFEEAFRRWVSGLVPAIEGTLAVDGKTVRGSGDGGARPIHQVSAFATDLGIVLGQEKVTRKSNEITAIPELLNALLIKGYLVTIDAMGCQTGIAETIVAKEADYLLAVKGNQLTLLTPLQDRFALDQRDPLRNAAHCFEQVEESHGRLVAQRSWVAPNRGEVDTARWPNCKMLATVESWRTVGGKPSDLERRYYISSRLMTAEVFAKAVRGHWGIENRLHWMLDVSFGEDAATVRKDFTSSAFLIARPLLQRYSWNPFQGLDPGMLRQQLAGEAVKLVPRDGVGVGVEGGEAFHYVVLLRDGIVQAVDRLVGEPAKFALGQLLLGFPDQGKNT